MIYYGKPFLQYCKKHGVRIEEYFILYSVFHDVSMIQLMYQDVPIKILHSLQNKGYIQGVMMPDWDALHDISLTDKGEDFLMEYYDSYEAKRADDIAFDERKYEENLIEELEKKWKPVSEKYPSHNGKGRALKTKKSDCFKVFCENIRDHKDNIEDMLKGMENYISMLKRHNKMEYIQNLLTFMRDRTYMSFLNTDTKEWVDDI